MNSDPTLIAAKRRLSGSTVFWEFMLPGRILLERGRVVQFERDQEHGVQRNLRLDHARGMAASLRARAPFPDNIVVNMVGDIVHDEETLMIDPKQITIELIDGQHRHAALNLLDVTENEDDQATIDHYSFLCSAVINANDALRRTLFLQQTKRRPVTRQQKLALQMASDSFENATDKDAMWCVETLNVSERSPLHGRIVFSEATGDTGRSTLKSGQMRANSLHSALRPVVSVRNKGNPLREEPLKKRAEIIIRMLRGAQSTLKGFDDPNHVLHSPLGISALIALISRHEGFHLLLTRASPTNPYTEVAFAKVFEAARGFNWKGSIKAPYAIADRLDKYLSSRFVSETKSE